jgi:hypothetical protein
LLRPDWPSEQAQMRELVGRLREGLTAASSERRILERRLDDLDAALAARASAAQLETLVAEVRELRRVSGMQARATARAARHTELLDAHSAWQHQVERLLARAARRGGLVAGPWTGEVGFEVLYWIPFLRYLRSRLRADVPLFAVSRGGAGAWYDGVATATAELFDECDLEAFRAATSGETRKQRRATAFERHLLRAACRRLGARRPAVAHPSLLFQVLYPYLKDHLAARALFEHLRPSRLPVPVDPLPQGLPTRYVAARFYFSQCFPDTPENQRVVRSMVAALAAHTPVVVLGAPFAVDDHRDAPVDGLDVVDLTRGMQPRDNLAVQSAVLARADGFVGTYGGFSYLAPFYDVPAVALYSHATFFPHHLDVARRAYDQLGLRGLTVLQVAEADLVASALGADRPW